MSQTIWTQCAGSEQLRSIDCEAWRAVEAQHEISTSQIVAGIEKQQRLDELIDQYAKPAMPSDLEEYDYLIKSAFRYGRDSRFGRRWGRGIWYGCEDAITPLYELGFYRLSFRLRSQAVLDVIHQEWTVFPVHLETTFFVDLTQSPFSHFRDSISDPSSWLVAQQLGSQMRAAHVHAFRYDSARRSEHTCLGVFDPKAFPDKVPRMTQQQTWWVSIRDESIEFRRKNTTAAKDFEIPIETYMTQGNFPDPIS